MTTSPIEEKVLDCLNREKLDLRETKYRYMDQKVTPDVLAFVADCVMNLPPGTSNDFTKNDIWHSEYFSKNVVFIYNKPEANNETTMQEYDKFCAQPLKTLTYAGVLKEEKLGSTNHYAIADREVLEYISLSDRNAFNFLRIYLQEVMEKSGFYGKINHFLERSNVNDFSNIDYADLKSAFERFTLGSSNIKQLTEVRRIFPKVINIFAVAHGAPGSKSGKVSDGRYPYSDLMYNSTNFRDLKKLKNISRQEAMEATNTVEEYNKYEEHKAMKAVRERHAPNSEVRDLYAVGNATQVHHIFPKSKYSGLRSSLENLILLTATQHNSKAHPENKTQYIDADYQLECLLAKSTSVQNSIMQKDGFYSKEGLVTVLNAGLNLEVNADMSFETINQHIRQLRQSK